MIGKEILRKRRAVLVIIFTILFRWIPGIVRCSESHIQDKGIVCVLDEFSSNPIITTKQDFLRFAPPFL
jgi:hypothetical protein